ncbi:hypothetical protein M8044_000128 [Columbia Basin potato purple top phytoplasma]|uniref:Uncharacterized protein n=1 Tax=Columbia Basin potato purple top phytoplasma TaxID=307134 RepID=A0ABT5L9H9_9MOLU|nr:hypothetical protein [Columbia Basin potato purple top phytoplasma]
MALDKLIEIAKMIFKVTFGFRSFLYILFLFKNNLILIY